ncbi:MAG: YihY/virulence factor BrkB family protein [Actinomycetia bacterium]|nr:YihY/virulence factor BrkB family protein [Actinomycetes bacterium]
MLAFITLGLVLSNAPEARDQAETFLRDALPLLFDPDGAESPIDIEKVAGTTLNAGVISVVGLVVAGLGWVDGTLEGVRRMQGAMRRPRSWFLVRIQDTFALLTMGTVLLTALVGAIIVEAFGASALEWAGVAESARWLVTLSAATTLGLLVWLVVAALYGLAWWGRPGRSWGAVLLGSLYTTVSMVLLTQLSFLVVGRTLSNPVYGALAVAAAILVFLYVASAVLLYFACWVAVCEGAPRTREELAYVDRLKGGAIALPAVDPAGDALASAALQKPPSD